MSLTNNRLLFACFLALAAALPASWPAPAHSADEPAICHTIADIRAQFPKSKIEPMTDREFKDTTARLAADGNPAPEGVTHAYEAPAEDDATFVVLMGFDKDDCIVAHATISAEEWQSIIGIGL